MGLKKRTVYFEGRVVNVSVDEIVLPNGAPAALEIVRHPGGAAVLAIDESRRVCLLRHYRYAVNDWLWELPAGKLEPSEPPLETARRELGEEAGVQAANWQSLGTICPSPGVLTEIVHLFLATSLSAVSAAPEAHEAFEVHWVPFSQAYDWAVEGTLRDAKTAIALFRSRPLLDEPVPKYEVP